MARRPSDALQQPTDDELAEAVERAGNDYERWSGQVARTGNCARPVRLVGKVVEVHKDTGEVRGVFDTANEPDRNLLIACGNRRESRCPSCAAVYRSDAFHIVASGLRGGKGVPESVAEHPSLFVTFTAPSFGAVHAHRATGSVTHPCRPRRAGKCPHGLPLACWRRHDPEDDCVGQALCPRCFDYEGLVLWNALAPELWRRTTIYIRRALAEAAGMSEQHLRELTRLSYVKVAEYQRRGAVHFHAVLRLDGVCEDAHHYPPPPEALSADLLEQAVRVAAAKVAAPLPTAEQSSSAQMVAGWGRQLDVRAIGTTATMTPRAVAAYVAKYATKSSDDLGCGELGALDARVNADRHLVMLVRAAERLGERLELSRMRLPECAHALGFKGHWSTKSRRYSTTFRQLRHARRQHARLRCSTRIPLGEAGNSETDVDIERRSEWRYVGSGYRNPGEAYLAMCAATRAREYHRLAREDLSIRAMQKGMSS